MRSPTSSRRIDMSLTPAVDPVAAPLLGEHTEQVLRDTLGYDDRRIVEFAQKGVFGSRKPSSSA